MDHSLTLNARGGRLQRDGAISVASRLELKIRRCPGVAIGWEGADEGQTRGFEAELRIVARIMYEHLECAMECEECIYDTYYHYMYVGYM